MDDVDLTNHTPILRATAPGSNLGPSLGLPPEILLLVFEWTQALWPPCKVSRSNGFRYNTHGEPLPPVYDLGWMRVMHVCNLWRELAESSPSLWQTHYCLNIPPQMIPDILARSQNMLLELRVEESEAVRGAEAAQILLPWIHDSISCRVKKIRYETSTIVGNSLDAHISRAILPSLQQLEIVWATMSPRIIPLRTGALGMQTQTRALSHLTYYGVVPEWNSPLFSNTLTHLSLGYPAKIPTAHYWGGMPSSSQFQHLLRGLCNLQRLDLHDFLPRQWSEAQEIAPESAYQFTLRCLKVVIECRQVFLSADYKYFWQNFISPPSTTLILSIHVSTSPRLGKPYARDNEMLAPFDQDIRNGWLAQELHISAHRFHLYHEERPRTTWTAPEPAPRYSVDPARHSAKDWTLENVQEGRYLCHIETLRYLPSRLLHASVRAISLAPDIMEEWKEIQDWIRNFSRADAVQRLALPLLHVLPLLQALACVTNGKSVFLPSLQIVVITEKGKREDMEGDRYLALRTLLLQVVRTRELTQQPIREVLVNRQLSDLDVWGEMAKETNVSFL